MHRLGHGDWCRIVLVADDDGGGHGHARQFGAQVGRAQHAAGFDIGRHVVAQEYVDALPHHVGTPRAECVAEPARGLEFDQRRQSVLGGACAAFGPLLGGLRPVPSRGVDQAEAQSALRIGGREGERHTPAHGCARNQRRCPADMVEQVGEVVRKQFDGVGAGRFVGGPVPAAVEGEHRHLGGQLLGDRLPEGAIHGERMDEHDPRGGFAVLASPQSVDDALAVTRLHDGRRRSRACFQVWRTGGHGGTSVGRPGGGTTQEAAARGIFAHPLGRVKSTSALHAGRVHPGLRPARE